MFDILHFSAESFKARSIRVVFVFIFNRSIRVVFMFIFSHLKDQHQNDRYDTDAPLTVNH